MFGGSDSTQVLSDTWEYGHLAIRVSPEQRIIRPGGTTSYTVEISGSSMQAKVLMSDLPLGVSGWFSPTATLTPPARISLVLTASQQTHEGLHPLSVTVMARDLAVSASALLSVTKYPYCLYLPLSVRGSWYSDLSAPSKSH